MTKARIGASWAVAAANSTPHSTPSTVPRISAITSGVVRASRVVKINARCVSLSLS